MIDNIALTETLPSNTGWEDSAIPLSTNGAALTDTDGSEILAVAINALSIGTTLSDGVNRFTATAGNTNADITGWNLAKLTLLPPADFNGTLNLTVVATAMESANGDSASTTSTLVVTVLPVNDAPVALNASYQLRKGGSVRIDFSTLVSDGDGDPLNLSFAKPAHGKLTRNADGSYTYTPSRGYSGTDTFTYTVSDGRTATTARITLVVGSGRHDEDDGCDNDDDCRHNTACIVVQSKEKRDRDDEHDEGHWFAMAGSNGKGAAATEEVSDYPRVDWNGCVARSDGVIKPDWVAGFLGVKEDERSLAERTGLVVKLMS